MRQKTPRNIWWLLLGISGISALGWFINTYEPISVPLIAAFFLIVFTSVFLTSLFFLNNVRRALLVSLGVNICLFLRLLSLREFYYVILLVAVLASLEMMLQKG